MTETLTVTERTRLRRAHLRGAYDRRTIHAILDAMPLAHVGYLLDGAPAVTPTLQWREGERVYWHGSAASRALGKSENHEVCLTVSLLDGFVLARSGFHHSVNYRSVMIFGRAEIVDDPAEKAAKLKNLVDAFFPGRHETLRPDTDQEIKGTTILSLPIEEASAKVRSGGPVDDDEDYALPIWAGVVPVTMRIGAPEPDPRNLDGVDMPAHVGALRLG